MIQLPDIRGVTIGGKAVLRISRGATVLWEKGPLPAAYRQLEYIETGGGPYIDTGVKASDYSGGIRYCFRGCALGYLAAANNNYLFGCLNSSKRSGNASLHTGNKCLSVYLSGNSAALLKSSELPALGTDFEFILTATSAAAASASATLNGTQLTVGYTPTNSAMPEANIWLLHCNGVGASSQPLWGRLRSFTMDKPDGTPIRCFIPCQRKADSVVGLYDTVSGAFFTNAGTGAFTAGPEV